eukprot:444207_1
MANSRSRKLHKKSKKRERRKFKDKLKRRRNHSQGGDAWVALGGMSACVLGVGAFAFALWFKRKQNMKSSDKSMASHSSIKPSVSSPPKISTNISTVNRVDDKPKLESIIDKSKLSKPLKDFAETELRQLAKSTLCRNIEESRLGERVEEDEREFIAELRKAGLTQAAIGLALNRPQGSIANVLQQQSGHYTPRARGDRQPPTRYDPPMGARVQYALETLPNWTGSTGKVCEIVEGSYTDLDQSICAGKGSLKRWQDTARVALRKHPAIIKVGKEGRQALWQLISPTEAENG